MMQQKKEKAVTSRKFLLLFFLSFVLFYRSLFNFFTNDDFFHLKISRVSDIKDFVNFFNLNQGPDGLGLYRPLTTQAYYFLDWKLFDLNPLGLHIISFAVFFGIIYLVYKLAIQLTGNESLSFTASLLYATSATHYGQLYYLGAFQELGLAFFFILSVINFIKLLQNTDAKNYLWSLVFFTLALLSKETAVVLPFALGLVYVFYWFQKRTRIHLRSMVLYLTPYLLLLIGYLYMRFNYYGFATGDSYIWNFSLAKVVNTLGWYGLWSFNLPEMLVDYVGPNFAFNPNLFAQHSKDIWPIFILFTVDILILTYSTIRSKALRNKSFRILFLFGILWFIGTLVPVLFLPIHKFTFSLTVPLFGAVLIISLILFYQKSKILYYLFIVSWLLISVFTLNLTVKTHWITTGAKAAKSVYQYFETNQKALIGINNIVFFDQPQDSGLPWVPTKVLKTTLSDNNFFKVFFDGKYTAWYGRENYRGGEAVYLWARQFLGY